MAFLIITVQIWFKANFTRFDHREQIIWPTWPLRIIPWMDFLEKKTTFFVWHLFRTQIGTKNFGPKIEPIIQILFFGQKLIENMEWKLGPKVVVQKFRSIGRRVLPVGMAVFLIGGITIFGSSTLGWAYIGFGEISSG